MTEKEFLAQAAAQRAAAANTNLPNRREMHDVARLGTGQETAVGLRLGSSV